MKKCILSIALCAVISLGLLAVQPVSTSAGVPLMSENGRTFGINRDACMALKNDGSVWTWGHYGSNQLGISYNEQDFIVLDDGGIGRTAALPTPTRILDGAISIWSTGTITDIQAFAIKGDDSLWGWGSGYTGNGRQAFQILSNAACVVSNNMAITKDGALWCWGMDGVSVVSYPQFDDLNLIKLMDNVAFVSSSNLAGNTSTLAIKTDGSLWAWGLNGNGQLGDGTNIRRETPVKIMDNVIYALIDFNIGMAIKSDNSLWAWGLNTHGQIGNGTTQTQLSPVKVMDSVIAIDARADTNMALKADGSLWAWGRNRYGQIGDGTLVDRHSPVKIMDGVMLPSRLPPGPITPIAPTTPATPTPTTPPPTPSDQPSPWATGQVNAAIAAGLVPQSLQSRYNQSTTRAEFCALAVALYENTNGEITGRSTFSDTNDVNVQKAAFIGVVGGVGNNRFAPDDTLTREQAATMLTRLADAVGKPFPKLAPTFTDKAAISSWAFEAVGQAQAAGIMGGVDGNRFAPKDPYTREQSIATILRLFLAVK